ncbi:Phospholipase C 2 [Mycobacterium innocens]|uniref:Phospholipase C 2 n=1 Tax=Mycobacterium innocens TaxID=2341083 RepID=A0A498Q989_9MYCO|nr:Phospholipase C 2 [Mycobacterium innocens]
MSEHPALPVSIGAVGIVDVLRILLSNPAVWEKTAVIVNYDENGGFFDHVTPPTPPPGTPGEYVTVPDINAVPGSGGIRGPIGSGFRTPCIVISPYSRGPLMVHDTIDHTSTLKLISARFGVPVPNLSAWRNGVVGDMTSTFNFAVPPNPSKPNSSFGTDAFSLSGCVCAEYAGARNGSARAFPAGPVMSKGRFKVEPGTADCHRSD